MVGDHPLDGWRPSFGWSVTILEIGADHPALHLVLILLVQVPNFYSVVHFLLVDFCGGFIVSCYLLVVMGGKQSQLPVQLTWSVLPDRTGV